MWKHLKREQEQTTCCTLVVRNLEPSYSSQSHSNEPPVTPTCVCGNRRGQRSALVMFSNGREFKASALKRSKTTGVSTQRQWIICSPTKQEATCEEQSRAAGIQEERQLVTKEAVNSQAGRGMKSTSSGGSNLGSKNVWGGTALGSLDKNRLSSFKAPSDKWVV